MFFVLCDARGSSTLTYLDCFQKTCPMLGLKWVIAGVKKDTKAYKNLETVHHFSSLYISPFMPLRSIEYLNVSELIPSSHCPTPNETEVSLAPSPLSVKIAKAQLLSVPDLQSCSKLYELHCRRWRSLDLWRCGTGPLNG